MVDNLNKKHEATGDKFIYYPAFRLFYLFLSAQWI